MPVLVTRNFDDDSIKNERANIEALFSIISLWDIFRRSRVANSVVSVSIWPKFELVRDFMHVLVTCKYKTGRGSSIGSEFVWHASGPEFDPHVRHILSWRLGHENISTAILPLPLIQEEQLSVTGERTCTKYW